MQDIIRKHGSVVDADMFAIHRDADGARHRIVRHRAEQGRGLQKAPVEIVHLKILPVKRCDQRPCQSTVHGHTCANRSPVSGLVQGNTAPPLVPSRRPGKFAGELKWWLPAWLTWGG